MTEQKVPDFWWTPSRGLIARTPGGYYLCGPTADPMVFFELPGDAVRLVPAPPAPRVFFPGDTVPGGVALANGIGEVLAPHPFPYTISGGPTAAYVEVIRSTYPAWHAAVDRARAERKENQDGD